MKDTKMNLNDMAVPELRKLAAEFGISGRSTMKKAELIAALSADEFASILQLKAGIAEVEAEEREMNEIRAEIAVEQSNVEAVAADKVIPARMFDPELTYYADGTHVVMRAQNTEQRGIAVGMTTDASPYQFQAVRFADGTVKSVAPHVLHRDDAAEQSDVESIEDTMQALANAEADAECEQARRLAEYDAEDEARALLADTTPRRVYSVPTEGVRLDVDHYDSRAATIDVYTNAAGLDRILYASKKGRVWEIATEDNGVRTVVRALSLNKLVKRWAKKAGIWADITITRSY